MTKPTKKTDDEILQQDMTNEQTAEPVAEPKKSEQKKVNKASAEIQQLKEENTQLNEKILRNFAEFDNFKKRTQKEKLELTAFTKSNCFTEIINAIDNFERALSAPCKDEEYKKGMEMIFNQLISALTAQGVEEIAALNEPFNPEFHNAISKVEDENLGENIVSAVMQKGYKIGDKIIRHAMVVVANS